MKTFRDFINEEGEGGGMVSSVPANAVGDASTIDNRVAGLGTNPPVGKRKKKIVMTSSPLKRTAPIKM
jgi:hypothetical protein